MPYNRYVPLHTVISRHTHPEYEDDVNADVDDVPRGERRALVVLEEPDEGEARVTVCKSLGRRRVSQSRSNREQ